MKIHTKKITIFTIFFILNLFLINKTFAANLILIPSKNLVGTGEQFYVDLMLNPEGESVNTINGSISFSSDSISFIRAEEGKSMVNLWVEKPKLEGNKLIFSGVMSSGFSGVIDPFKPEAKLPGLIIRLVFETKTKGEAVFSSDIFSLNLNDGLGTEIKAPAIDSSIVTINNTINHSKYESKIDSSPELEAYITRDPNISNNKYILIFKATDKETGIKSVKIKEGRTDWKEIESPYVLKDQSRHSYITVQAMNFNGAGVIVNIDKIPYDLEQFIDIFIIFVSILILCILIFIKKKYAKKI